MASTSSSGGPDSTPGSNPTTTSDAPAGGRGAARTRQAGTGTPAGRALAGRALAVLVAFGVVSALVLGQVHPGNANGAGLTAGGARAVTSTSAPAKKQAAAPTTTTTTTVPPSQIPVLMANGAGVANAAADAATIAKVAGYATLPPVNATTSVQTSGVYFVVGEQAAAAAVANLLHFPATSVHPLDASVPVASPAGADVVVVIGTDEGHAVAALAAGG